MTRTLRTTGLLMVMLGLLGCTSTPEGAVDLSGALAHVSGGTTVKVGQTVQWAAFDSKGIPVQVVWQAQGTGVSLAPGTGGAVTPAGVTGTTVTVMGVSPGPVMVNGCNQQKTQCIGGTITVSP